MKWDKFIDDTFQLKEWDYIDPKIINYIKDNFLTLNKDNVKKLHLPKKLTHHISIRLEYLEEFSNIRP